MTGFGIYLLILWGLSAVCSLILLGRGEGYYTGTGTIAFGLALAVFNIVGLLLWGTGVCV